MQTPMPTPPRPATQSGGDVCRALTELSEILDEHYTRRQETLDKTFQRLSYAIILIGLVSIMTIALLYRMIDSLSNDMNNISQRMNQISEAMPAMLPIAFNMQSMTEAVMKLDSSVSHINEHFLALNIEIQQMNVKMGHIDQHVASVTVMDQSMRNIVGIMQAMQYDTHALRYNVGDINRNANTLMMPMRLLSGGSP
jgi:methyl-accepting chemotaxis protein